jgi:CRP-like cAMP-binding protein
MVHNHLSPSWPDADRTLISRDHPTADQVLSLIPINSLDARQQDEVLANGEVLEFKRRRVVFRAGSRDPYTFYLVNGELELQPDDAAPMRMSSNDLNALRALAQLQPRRYTARALSNVEVFRIERAVLDRIMTEDHADRGADVEVTELHGDEEAGDWMSRLLNSELFTRLPHDNIQRFFSELEPVEVAAGEAIVEQGTPGDYLFIVAEGECEVVRRAPGSGNALRLATLQAGDTFGEEALISNSPRNASVSMLTDGVVMRLPKASFEELVRNPTLKAVTYSEARRLVREGAVWLDVRFKDEHEAQAIEGSLNAPLNALRLEARKLDPARRYVVYCDTGVRSSTGAFLLARMGLDACYLAGGLERSPLGEGMAAPTAGEDGGESTGVDFEIVSAADVGPVERPLGPASERGAELATLRAERDKAAGVARQATDAARELKRRYSELREAAQAERAKREATDRDLANLRADAERKLAMERTRLEGELSKATQRVTELEQSRQEVMDKARERRAALEARIEEAEQRLEAVTARAAEAEQRLDEVGARDQATQRRLDAAGARAADVQGRLDETGARVAEAERRLDEERARAEQAEQHAAEMAARAAQVEQGLGEANRRAEELTTRAAQAEQGLDETRARALKVERHLEEAGARAARAEQALEESRERVETLETARRALEADGEGALRSAREQAEAERLRAERAEQELAAVQVNLEATLETADQARESEAARESALRVSLEEARATTQAEREALAAERVALGEQAAQVEHGLEELERERQALEHSRVEIEQGRAALGQQQAELEQQQAELEQVRAALDHGHAELEQGRVELDQRRAQAELHHTELEQGRQDLGQRREALDREREGLGQERAELERGRQGFEQGLRELEESRAELEKNRQRLEEELREGRAALVGEAVAQRTRAETLAKRERALADRQASDEAELARRGEALEQAEARLVEEKSAWGERVESAIAQERARLEAAIARHDAEAEKAAERAAEELAAQRVEEVRAEYEAQLVEARAGVEAQMAELHAKYTTVVAATRKELETKRVEQEALLEDERRRLETEIARLRQALAEGGHAVPAAPAVVPQVASGVPKIELPDDEPVLDARSGVPVLDIEAAESDGEERARVLSPEQLTDIRRKMQEKILASKSRGA